MNQQVARFYVVVSAFASGVFIASIWSIHWAIALWVLLLCIGVSAICWFQHRFTNHEGMSVFCLLILIGISSFFLGALRIQLAERSFDYSLLNQIDQEISFEGVVRGEPEQRERTTHLYVETDYGTVLVYASRYSTVQYGDRILLTGTVQVPESFTTDLGRTFDYPGYLKAQGVTYVMRYAEIEQIRSGEGNKIIALLLSGKQKFIATLETLIVEPHAGLAEGLLLGVKRALGSELESAFRETGIIHIVVLSGYNIMLVVIFVSAIVSICVPPRWQMPIGIVAIVAFATIVGFSATVLRASLMAVFALYARATGRVYAAMRGLVLAGLCMLLWNPYLLVYDIGFQLSFIATFGLILLAPLVESKLYWVPRIGGLREILTATIATQIFVLPILLYHIGQFSVVSILVNVLVLPAVPIAMLLSFVATVLAFVSSQLAIPFAFGAYIVLAYILGVAVRFAAIPFASYTVPTFSFWVVILAYSALGAWLWYMYRGRIAYAQQEDSVAGWIIEDEESLTKRLQKNRTSQPDAPSSHLPIFFR